MAVIGAGYVGLPTAATLSHFGHRVTLAERDEARLTALRSGRMPIVEAGLDELVAGSVQAGTLHFTRSAVEAVAGAEFVFLCVPTPQGEDGSADPPMSRRPPRRSAPTSAPARLWSTSPPCRSARPPWSSR